MSSLRARLRIWTNEAKKWWQFLLLPSKSQRMRSIEGDKHKWYVLSPFALVLSLCKDWQQGNAFIQQAIFLCPWRLVGFTSFVVFCIVGFVFRLVVLLVLLCFVLLALSLVQFVSDFLLVFVCGVCFLLGVPLSGSLGGAFFRDM